MPIAIQPLVIDVLLDGFRIRGRAKGRPPSDVHEFAKMIVVHDGVKFVVKVL